MTLKLETQEAETGTWFAVVTYTPGTMDQLADARARALGLEALGLYARVDEVIE